MKRLLVLAVTLLLFQFLSYARPMNDTMNTALLIIDIQNFYFLGSGLGLMNAEGASLNAKEVLQIFREKEQLIVHVRHKAAKGFEIHKNVAPLPGEKVLTKEEINSFQKTDLLKYLRSKHVHRLVIVGMQTQMCVEAATRAGYDFGFECILIGDACATRDVKFAEKVVKAADVHASTLATLSEGGYAKVIDTDTFRENANSYLIQSPE